MKTDLDLIRKMTLLIVDGPTGHAPHPLVIDGYTDDQIGYHAYLMVNSGLAVGASVASRASPGPNYRLIHLTSSGHDFAEKARPQYICDEGGWRN